MNDAILNWTSAGDYNPEYFSNSTWVGDLFWLRRCMHREQRLSYPELEGLVDPAYVGIAYDREAASHVAQKQLAVEPAWFFAPPL